MCTALDEGVADVEKLVGLPVERYPGMRTFVVIGINAVIFSHQEYIRFRLNIADNKLFATVVFNVAQKAQELLWHGWLV